MPHDIFISYSRRDLAAVKPIKEELERLGFSCWMDLQNIESGSRQFSRHIIDAIDGSTSMLFFLSFNSQTSEWALKEIDYATSEKKHVVLLRFNDDAMTKEFRFDFGRADIIDWRIPEQKGKLSRDLFSWAAGPKPSDQNTNHRTDAPPSELSDHPSEVKSQLNKPRPSRHLAEDCIAQAREVKGRKTSKARTKKLVTFTMLAEPGSSVYVVGSFNNWDPQDKALSDKNGDGRYTVTISLDPGTYEYKFVINGVWTLDPNCEDWAQNSLGTLNSVLRVK